MAEIPAVPSLPQRCTITRAGASFGPYTLEEIKTYAAEGRLFLTDQAWPEGAAVPTTVAALLNPQDGRDVTDGVIPYKNPAALASYYVGLSGVIPVLGIFTGLAAVILGIRGLRRFHAEPWRRGRLHSYAGILVGSVTSLTWIALLAWFIPQMLRVWLRYHS
jgi:hypothetical protein